MAIATQSANLVWQKVKNALSAANANPAAQGAFQDLKFWLSQQKKNIDLQFIPFAAEDIVTNGGYCPDVDACTVYGVWVKGRRTTGTTSSFFALHDATDNSATTTTILTERFKATGQEFSWVSGVGQPIATDITLSAATAVGGATESSAADAGDGFVIIGA